MLNWLKELLKNSGIEDIKADEIVSNINREIPKYMIPKIKYNKIAKSKKDLEVQLKAANDAIVELKRSNKVTEELQSKIEQCKRELGVLKTNDKVKINNLTLDNAIKFALRDNNVKYEDLLIGKFDRDKLTINKDGIVEGLEDQIKELKETYKDLFTDPLGGFSNSRGIVILL